MLGSNLGLITHSWRFACISCSVDSFVSDASIILEHKSVESVTSFATIGDCLDLRDPTSNESGVL